jgi:hypothetical protein
VVGNTEGKRTHGRLRHRGKMIDTDLKNKVKGVYWIHLAEDRFQLCGLVKTLMTFSECFN